MAPSSEHPTFEIPGKLNLLLLAGAAVSAALCLWLASHADNWPTAVLAALVFSYVNNTLFSLMHEAAHRKFHDNVALNEAGGRIASAFFPTSFALQRVFHEAHHQNNRTVVERFDYYASHENRFLKYAQWYCILTGLYWIAAPAFSAIYMVFANIVDWNRLFSRGNRFARQTSAEPFLDSLKRVDVFAARRDAAFSILVQAGLIIGLGLTWSGWFLCYAFFAVNWSSLQYADHAFSPLDQTEGAWNLKFNPIARVLFLNYNLHLNHHRSPGTPWIHLSKLARSDDAEHSFWKIYLRMWKGPQPLPASGDEPTARS
ncbi:MAG TPA: fatty acid desaturase [Bradyrhizobium sp.]|nr:fatty acid desaturase [Bradyrhizobium sp.]